MKTDSQKTGSTVRRKLLKKIGAGGGVLATASAVPGEWSKPIVKGILLPAHAATTATDSLPGEICNPEYGFLNLEDVIADYHCSRQGPRYRLICYATPGVDVQVEVSGTGVCPAAEGPHDNTSPGYETSSNEEDGVPYTEYKWRVGEDCDAPESFTAVFSIADSCDEPLVVEKGTVYDDCNEGQKIIKGV